MDPSKDALRDPPRHIGPLVPRLMIVDFHDARLLLENPADGLLAQSPQLRDLIDRIMLLARNIRSCVFDYPDCLHRHTFHPSFIGPVSMTFGELGQILGNLTEPGLRRSVSTAAI
jgi:hypothetical protein